MRTTDLYLLKSCAQCGEGCDLAHHHCEDCRFLYCEAHRDREAHDCQTVCVELSRDELELEELRRTPQLSLVFPSPR